MKKSMLMFFFAMQMYSMHAQDTTTYQPVQKMLRIDNIKGKKGDIKKLFFNIYKKEDTKYSDIAIYYQEDIHNLNFVAKNVLIAYYVVEKKSDTTINNFPPFKEQFSYRNGKEREYLINSIRDIKNGRVVLTITNFGKTNVLRGPILIYCHEVHGPFKL